MKNNAIKSTVLPRLPKFKWFWKYNEKDKAMSRPVTSAQVLINGKLVVFIFCSLVSAFINLVFISNLSKSNYDIGTLISVPAAVLLGSLSIGLDIAKFLLAIQVNTLNELIRKLSKFNWVKNVKRAAIWWKSVYITFIILSVITSMSLSSISIGAGITRNANLINQIDEYIIQGEQYTNINAGADAVTRENLISKATDTSEKDARDYAENAVAEIEDFIATVGPIVLDEYVDDENIEEGGKTAFQKKNEALKPYEARRQKINNILKGAGYRARSFDELVAFNTMNLAADIKQKRLDYLQSSSNDIAVEKLGELKENTNVEIYSWLETLNALALVNPKTNEPMTFDTSNDKPANVLAKSATQLLKALRVDVENDSGDIGSSSKIFMQFGSIFASKKLGDKDLQAALNVKAQGSFGATEIMMMGMLLFLSLLCELAINLFSPKTNISRKMLSQFSAYFDPDFNVDDFMMDVYIDQLKFGVLDRESFDRKSKKAVELTEITKESLYERYSKKNKSVVLTKESKEVEKLKNKIRLLEEEKETKEKIEDINASLTVTEPISESTSVENAQVDSNEEYEIPGFEAKKEEVKVSEPEKVEESKEESKEEKPDMSAALIEALSSLKNSLTTD